MRRTFKDHSSDECEEGQAALADYTAAARQAAPPPGRFISRKMKMRISGASLNYCKRAGIGVIVAVTPAPETLPRIEKFVKEYDIRFAIHNHGPEDKLWHSPLDVLKAVKGMDPRIGCLHRCWAYGSHGHGRGAGDSRGRRGGCCNMHMKDLTSFQDKESQVGGGRGHHAGEEDF